MTYNVTVKEQYIKLDLRPSYEDEEEECLEFTEQNIRISNDMTPMDVKDMKRLALKSV